MGQYLKDRKIGTCESMYYMRLSEAKELARIGEKDNDGISFKEYLADGVTRWRFPFPSEDLNEGGDDDGGDIMAMQKAYNKGFKVPAGGIEIGHDTICVHNEHEGGGHGVNIFLPCPYSKEFTLKTSTGGAGEQFLSVKYQAMRYKNDASTGEMEEKTIFACARCGSQQRFSDDDIEKIKARATEYFSAYDTRGKNLTYSGNQGLYFEAMKIIKRIK